MLYIAILIVTIFLLPDRAYAWGPATHLEIGMGVLKNLIFVAPAIRGILERFPYDYLYGNISADMVVAKNLAQDLRHCHNWRIGFNLLGRAGSDPQRAFAYGYLSHLAADTVAHNLFIPERMIISFSAPTLRHVYWELRFDAPVDRLIWQVSKGIEKGVHRENDRLFNLVVPRALLPFRASKTIFSGILLLHSMEKWQRMIEILSTHSRWTLNGSERMIYYQLSSDAVMGLLSNGHLADCLKKDPRGKQSIDSAKYMRKRLKALSRKGKEDWEGAMDRAINEIRSPYKGSFKALQQNS